MISISIAESDSDLVDIALLKKADDSETIGREVSDSAALDKILSIRDEGYNFWIARDVKAPVGYAVGIARDNFYLSTGLYVLPNYRLRGIGSSLKKAQIEFARELGCDEFITHVGEENKASIRVQKKFGFTFEPSGLGFAATLALK